MKKAFLVMITILTLTMLVFSGAWGKECEEIMDATQAGKYDEVKKLIDDGCNVNFEGRGGNTPIIPAILNGNIDLARLLIDNGADVKIQNEGGVTPLLLLAHTEILTLVAIKQSDRHEELKKMEKDDPEGLLEIVKGKVLDLAKLCIEKGADVNIAITHGNFKGMTPLMIATLSGNIDMINLFINNNADLTLKDRRGNTALKLAKDMMNDTLINLLEKAGAKE